MMWTTSSGRTDWMISTMRMDESGACSGGLMTTALPTASAGASLLAV